MEKGLLILVLYRMVIIQQKTRFQKMQYCNVILGHTMMKKKKRKLNSRKCDCNTTLIIYNVFHNLLFLGNYNLGSYNFNIAFSFIKITLKKTEITFMI